MKILFLDHQGVLYTRKHPCPGTLDNFNTDAIEKLNDFLQQNKTMQIVVSSDWKLWVKLSTMQEFYLRQGICRQPIDYTPNLPRVKGETLAERRAREIHTWLTEHTDWVDWIAIDDLDMRNLLKNFIWISDPLIGIVAPGIKLNFGNAT